MKDNIKTNNDLKNKSRDKGVNKKTKSSARKVKKKLGMGLSSLLSKDQELASVIRTKIKDQVKKSPLKIEMPKLSEKENFIRNQRLSDEIGNKLFAELTGSSKDFSHQEKSFAIICSMQEAVKLGNDFQQKAIFFVSNGILKLVDCKSGESQDLGIFEKKRSIDPTNKK